MKLKLIALFLLCMGFLNAQNMVVGTSTLTGDAAVGLSEIAVIVNVGDTLSKCYSGDGKLVLNLTEHADTILAQSENEWLNVTVGTRKGIYKAGQQVLVNRKMIVKMMKDSNDKAFIRMRNSALSLTTLQTYNITVIDIVDGI